MTGLETLAGRLKKINEIVRRELWNSFPFGVTDERYPTLEKSLKEIEELSK